MENEKILFEKAKLKEKMKSKVIKFIVDKEPTISELENYVKTLCVTNLKYSDSMFISNFVCYAQALNDLYYAETDFECGLVEYISSKKQNKAKSFEGGADYEK